MICMYLFFMIGLMLSACSLKEDVALLYKQETPLESEIIIPTSFSDNEKEIIKVILTQEGKRVNDPDFVHFEIWKQDGSVHYSMEEAKELGNGTYSISKDFDSEGLYFVKVHASQNGSMIMPQKQFIVGELSKSELEYLQKGAQKQNAPHEHHH
ncbi:FixH family protein [Metabacillus sp. Hm71]|uniref:FixH family protein n=1 Tax=Metabacillus sp. Hm71 TaxID=3450743 RepID=UPI003F444918